MKPEFLKMETESGSKINLDALYKIVPSCFTETRDEKTGELRHTVDFDVLRRLLGDDAVEDAPEEYRFDWVGKQNARNEAAKPINKTLRPVPESSLNWDTTQNLYIEGDNLDALKLLQKSYMGKVKMIYIDPPYNTGNDFVYNDDFAVSKEADDVAAGNMDELGNHFRKNLDSNGRFHSDWCSMIYPRLMLAKTLLTEDGVIFISIDDNEVENLKKICNEVFGESNFIAQCVRKRRDSQANLSKNISPIHEYIILYANNNGEILNKVSANIDISVYKNPDNDPRGLYITMPCTNKGGAKYSVTTPTGKTIFEEWRFKRETYDFLCSENKIVFPKEGDGKPRYKLFLSDKMKEGQLANTWLDKIAANQDATKEVKNLFNNFLVFDAPKPVELLIFCEQLATNKDSIILDFFSGSATTAHAVMQLNAEDGGKRKFIMVQLPEKTAEVSEAYKAGYKDICEIGEERIRRAGRKIKNEAGLPAQDLDTGFRVFRIDESNMNDVYFAPKDYSQDELDLKLDNVKPGRTELDLLYGCMLNYGVPLSLPMKSETVDGCTIYTVNDGDLVACFAKDITENVVKAMAAKAPLRIIFRDSCFSQDDGKINIYESFKQLLDWSDDEAYKNIKVI